MRALVAGWFSFPGSGATAGDRMAAEVACEWLRAAGVAHDLALSPPVRGGIDWRAVAPEAYSHLVLVGGPFPNSDPAVTDFLDRFAHCDRVEPDAPVTRRSPERDGDPPDLSLLWDQPRVPVVGLCLVHPQKEYGRRGRHTEAGEAVGRLLAGTEAAVVDIDTRLDHNRTGLRTAGEVEALLARVDVVVTTRLHGTVLALKNGVPAVVIDPVAGGAKVMRQAGVLNWPVVFTPEELDEARLREAFAFCRTAEARALARRCADRAAATLAEVRERFLAGVAGSARPGARALVAGWFSWPGYGATAGDLMAADVACEWLAEAGVPFDRALAPPFAGGVDWHGVDPKAYSHLVFVCGPCGNGEPLTHLLAAFDHCYRVGLDLSMLQVVGEWNPFHLLLERDSDRAVRPDISLLCRQPLAPVAGLCLDDSRRKDDARRLLAAREVAVVPIDARLDETVTGRRTPAEVESLIARTDVVLTTEVQGANLALKNGVPPLVIDPVAGGAEVRRRAAALGWPVVFDADALDERALNEALDYCLTAAARTLAQQCADRARARLQNVRREFLDRFKEK